MPDEKILLVDDEENNLKLLTQWLHFDPAVLDTFKKIAPVFAEIYDQHQ